MSNLNNDTKSVNYADPSCWLCTPEEIVHPADTVYLLPTCYGPSDPNAPLICSVDCADMHAAAQKYLKIHAPVFSGSSNVFIPYYRQCNAFGMGSLSQEEVLKLYEGTPKHDIFAALDYYFEHFNEGRPFILAGHSQGSVMALYVLSQYFAAHQDLYRRMIAAYVIGFGVQDWVLKACPYLKMASGEGDTGVIISYNTEGPGNAGHSSVVVPPGSLAVNPLNWRSDDTYAPIELNKGSLYIDDNGCPYVGAPLADARIDVKRGTLICSSLKDASKYASRHVSSFGPCSYHSMDYSFYYRNLQDNVKLRIDNFLKLHSQAD